ncbi:hypothetical protein HPB52_001353 [Rhipicephalus sanguineus]|uniref:Transposase Tc1-like domain-containing protein n=1 Tax=Rhipicephalus sanguineus TaxID=34632 RepID=A0A9D4QFB7_RHISA|nr:hypothetical protein HPB52_001353 [Rhipicephalus sanguineus]
MAGRPRSSVNSIVKVFSTEARLTNLPRGHRPKVATDSDDERIVEAARRNPKMTAKEIRNDLGLVASTQVVRERLHVGGLRSRVAAMKPFVSFDAPNLHRVASSGRCSVNVWGSISKDGLGPLHDRSPVHTAASVKRLLEERCVMVLDWPPQGADMNIIENACAEMKKALSRRPLQKCSSDILWAAVEEEWQKLAPCVPHRQSARTESVVCSRRDISGVHRRACSVGMRKRTGLAAPRWRVHVSYGTNFSTLVHLLDQRDGLRLHVPFDVCGHTSSTVVGAFCSADAARYPSTSHGLRTGTESAASTYPHSRRCGGFIYIEHTLVLGSWRTLTARLSRVTDVMQLLPNVAKASAYCTRRTDAANEARQVASWRCHEGIYGGHLWRRGVRWQFGEHKKNWRHG